MILYTSFLTSDSEIRNLLVVMLSELPKKRDRYDFFDLMMTMISTHFVIPSQGRVVRLIEKESPGRQLSELPKKRDRYD